MNKHFKYSKVLAIILLFGAITWANTTLAANDPSIKGDVRRNIVASMDHHIKDNVINGFYHLYDAVDGKLLNLKFKKLHDGIVKKGNYYVSCADFIDQTGRAIDVDFMVMVDGSNYKTIQALVHSVDGQKRKYHLE